jgi:hypothetical protein
MHTMEDEINMFVGLGWEKEIRSLRVSRTSPKGKPETPRAQGGSFVYSKCMGSHLLYDSAPHTRL